MKKGILLDDLVNRCVDCMGCHRIYVWGELDEYLKKVYPQCRIQHISDLSECEDDALVVIRCKKETDAAPQWEQIRQYRMRGDMIVWVEDDPSDFLSLFSELHGNIRLLGKTFELPEHITPDKDFRVLAILHFYNEADILERTIRYLLSQDVDIYLVDNWSDDGSYEIAERYFEENREHIYLERFPAEGKTQYYEWSRQLERTEQISREQDYDWYIHYDADEMRVSPWENTSLRDCIYRVDQLGYNLIDTNVIDFRLTEQCLDDIFMKDTYFAFRHFNTHLSQLKAWKRTDDIDIKKYGGHIAVIKNPKVFPLKILNRHYPMRSVAQAEKKIFQDRIPRFTKEQKEKGWHSQYNGVSSVQDFIYDKGGLILWDDSVISKYYIPLFTGAGVQPPLLDAGQTECPNSSIQEKKLVIYGAGKYSRKAYLNYSSNNEIVAWVDGKYEYLSNIFSIEIQAPDVIKSIEYDYVIITAKKPEFQAQIKEVLLEMGVPENKILFSEFWLSGKRSGT